MLWPVVAWVVISLKKPSFAPAVFPLFIGAVWGFISTVPSVGGMGWFAIGVGVGVGAGCSVDGLPQPLASKQKKGMSKAFFI